MTDFVQIMSSNPLYGIGAAVVLALAFLIFYAIRTKGSTEAQKVDLATASAVQAEAPQEEVILLESEAREVNALVHDATKRAFGLRYVKLLPGKVYGRQWHYLNHLVYWLCLGMDGKLVPIVPTETLDHSPSELYEALETKEDIKTVLGPQSNTADKIRLGLLILAACVALFLMYLAAKGG